MERLCHRYGPGRLPYASRRDVGGGIAMAATALLATVLWFGGAWLLAAATASDTLGFAFAAGLFFVPLAVPTAFVVGTLLWRSANPDEVRPIRGAIFGAITSVASLAAGAVGLATILAVSNVSRGEMGLIQAAGFSAVLVPVGFFGAVVAAGWLILPLGVFGGWYHERSNGA